MNSSGFSYYNDELLVITMMNYLRRFLLDDFGATKVVRYFSWLTLATPHV